ncbi:MAG: LON peptidase substrate-binding domain-containing protein, partial [Desulfobacterales bacterium]
MKGNEMRSIGKEKIENALIAINKRDFPARLPILPIRNQIVFPTLHTSLAILSDSIKLLEKVLEGDRLMGIVGVSSGKTDLPMSEQVFKTGTIVKISYVTRAAEDTTIIVVEGLERFQVTQWLSEKPFLEAQITPAPEYIDDGLEIEALHRNLRDLCKEVFSLSVTAPKEAVEGLANIQDPLHMVYIAAAYSDIGFEKRQKILELNHLKDKLQEMVTIMTHEKEVLQLGQKIKDNVRDKMDKSQRDFYLRQQLNAIKKELGDASEEDSEAAEFRKRLENT